MIESPAFRALSLSAHRVLARIEIELGHHGGTDNGKLPVTYGDFEDYGIDKHSIAPAIRECVALGFLEVTEKGRAGNAEFRAPNLFRLTYPVTKLVDPTNDWAKIETCEEALAIAQAARKAGKANRKNKNPVGENTVFSGETPHRNSKSPVLESPPTSQGGETPTTFYISGRGTA